MLYNIVSLHLVELPYSIGTDFIIIRWCFWDSFSSNWIIRYCWILWKVGTRFSTILYWWWLFWTCMLHTRRSLHLIASQRSILSDFIIICWCFLDYFWSNWIRRYCWILWKVGTRFSTRLRPLWEENREGLISYSLLFTNAIWVFTHIQLPYSPIFTKIWPTWWGSFCLFLDPFLACQNCCFHF